MISTIIWGGGVDIADQLRSYYHTQLAGRRLWLPLFFWLLDTAIVNSYIIYRMYNPSASQEQFRIDMSKALRSSVDEPDHTHVLFWGKTQWACKAIGCTARTSFSCNICGYSYCSSCT